MTSIEIPNGVLVEAKGSEVVIKGKLGQVIKHFNGKYVRIDVKDGKANVTAVDNKKLKRKAMLAETAFSSELKDTMETVQKGIEQKMKLMFAHFPMSVEVKGNTIYLKNVFGEKVPREAMIIGSTKVEIKGQDFLIKGIDRYEIGQTIANIRKACYARGYDTRVFQDGVYIVTEE
ncbi:MAG: 50S ribosomal protein L6 [Candidatus Micrarchaeota archaeon]|nr:50S ribosomal protein L6 [Candidatus Micrarchaeota archaeon]